MSKVATVDRVLCKGHGRCYLTAPELFDCDDEGFAIVADEATTAEQIAELDRAASNCPEQAITAAYHGKDAR
ncbi:ferredoxin [Amycolatopsis benzoatilytica]|uniref:ferredoxin n=1 Tax=Amycolatopsis benzoatilytica TaxID=346045 RepID=UPI00036DE561|nr:ferredoxin [Amycolatopsis benzoatilytica]